MEEKKLNEPDSNLNDGSSNAIESADNNYIETIKELKNNSVSKKEYNDLLKQNKQLLDTLVKGENLAPAKDEVVMSDEDLKKLIKKTSRDTTNLDYITTMLAIRKEMIAKGLEDPMAPKVVNHTNDEKDYEKAQRVAEFLQDCVDKSNGDNETFKALFNAGLVDPKIPTIKKK